MGHFCDFKFACGLSRHKLEKRASKNQRAIREDCKENGGISVERLTTKRDWSEARRDLRHELGYSHIWKRLNAIEDILGDDYNLDRLKEIVEADKENRGIILKFGIGSTVYRLWVYPDGTKPFITENKINNIQDLINAESWTDVYKTKEEAEAALRRMQDG